MDDAVSIIGDAAAARHVVGAIPASHNPTHTPAPAHSSQAPGSGAQVSAQATPDTHGPSSS